MAHRLSRIVTRTGDKGETGLGSGARVPKDDPRIETLGAVDELNSWIGVLIAHALSAPVTEILTLVQHDLFDLGAQLSVPGTALLSEAHLARVEAAVEALNAGLGMLKEFILPGGAPSAGFAHIARTVCRRAERQLVTLGAVEGHGLPYLNRLSDLLFVASRIENKEAGQGDVLWQRGKSVGA